MEHLVPQLWTYIQQAGFCKANKDLSLGCYKQSSQVGNAHRSSFKRLYWWAVPTLHFLNPPLFHVEHLVALIRADIQ